MYFKEYTCYLTEEKIVPGEKGSEVTLLIFIGRNLDREQLNKGFSECLI